MRVLGGLTLGLLAATTFLWTQQLAEAGGRVPTHYNKRYQALFAEQELFRKRPELLGCVDASRDYVQNSKTATFNKLRFLPASAQNAFVAEELVQGKIMRKVRIGVEGRVRAYSFLENWESAEIVCTFVAGEPARVHLSVIE